MRSPFANGNVIRIVVSDLLRGRPIWFGGQDRSEESMKQCFDWLGEKRARGLRLAVMDMWKPFRNATEKARAPSRSPLLQIPRHPSPGRGPR